MKNFALVALFASTAASAVAADLPAPVASDPPPSAIDSHPAPWTGVYFGANAGGTWSSDAAIASRGASLPNYVAGR